MKFEDTLTPARLIKRYKRFLADAVLEDGTRITAHCANSGSMLGCAPPDATIWLSPNRNPKAKLDWRWEMVEVDGGLVGINTSRPNGLAEEAIQDGKIAELKGYESLKREVKYGKNSRIDILLDNHENGNGPCYVEVKNVTLRQEDEARFPDGVTARGAKHLEELSDMVRQGFRAVMLYLVQRTDCDRMAFAQDIDPDYAAAFLRAKEAGVEAYAYACDLSPQEITVARPLSIRAPDAYL